MSRIFPAFTLAAMALQLCACAKDTMNYPSLARRDAERIAGTAEVVPASPAPSAAVAAPGGEVSARIAALVASARDAHRRFNARRPNAEALANAASGAAMASESWSVASIALADLESARSDAMIALADLDQLYAASVIEGSNTAGIASARDSVIGLVGEEDSILARLRGRIAG